MDDTTRVYIAALMTGLITRLNGISNAAAIVSAAMQEGDAAVAALPTAVNTPS